MKKRVIDYFVPLRPLRQRGEKGVCYIAFEHRWARFVHHYRDKLEAFAKRYLLIVRPVWATPHGLINYYLPASGPATIRSSPASAIRTTRHPPRQSPRHVVIPRYCSHWVKPGGLSAGALRAEGPRHRDAGELRQIQTPLCPLRGAARTCRAR